MKLPRFKCLTCSLIWIWVEVKARFDFCVAYIQWEFVLEILRSNAYLLKTILVFVQYSTKSFSSRVAYFSNYWQGLCLICAIYWLILFIKTMPIIHSITPRLPIHEWPCFRLLLCFYMYWVFSILFIQRNLPVVIWIYGSHVLKFEL